MTNRKSLLGAGIAAALIAAVAGPARADDRAQLEQRVRELESELTQVKETLRGGYFTASSDLEARVSELERMAGDGSMGAMFKNGLKFEGNEGATKYSVFGMIQNDWGWYHDDADNYSGANINPGVEFRRIRLGVNGQVWGNVRWHSEVDFSRSSVRIADMWMELAHCAFGNIRVGYMKEPFGLDWQTSDKFNTFLERNAVYDLSNERSTGVMLHGACMEDKLVYQVGMFRDSNATGADTGNAKAGEYDLAGRISTRPILDEENKTWLHLGLSGGLRDYADDAVSYGSRPGFAQAPTMAGATFTADDGWQVGLEAMYVAGPISFLGEWARVHADVTGGDGADLDALSLEAGYWLTGESTAYDKATGCVSRTSPKKNFGDGEGTGAWQVALRYGTADYDDGSIAGGELDTWTLGVNWWLNPNTRVALNLIRANPDAAGFDEDLDIVALRFQLDF